MDKSVINLSEKEVQALIADYPWLLNLDYERVPQLKNKGMEYVLSDSKRADLILRDRKAERPVIVEFKAVPFYRENIGQILEYRARVVNEYTNEDSLLKEIFGEKLFAPILILVVPECTTEARLACNMSNIEIYEYNKTVPEIIVPEKRKTLDEFIETYKNDDIPLNVDRHEHVENIYEKIREVMEEEDVMYGWKRNTKNKSVYLEPLNNLFINKCLFCNESIMLGIYEDIFDESSCVKIEYYSDELEALKKFAEKYRELNLTPINNTQICNEEAFSGSWWTFKVDKKEFLKNTKEIVRTYIQNYIKVMNQIEFED